jgi:hypothetical protein
MKPPLRAGGPCIAVATLGSKGETSPSQVAAVRGPTIRPALASSLVIDACHTHLR